MLPVTVAPRVSVLVPAFNEEAHLPATLRGLVAAMEARREAFEVVIVNDGSTDRTGIIADAWAAEDGRVVVVHHERNQGLGRSYFDGIRGARGEHITWIPGDDAIPAEALGPLLDVIGRADVVVSYPVFDTPRPAARRLFSSGYTTLMNTAFGLRLRYYNCVTVVPRLLLLEIEPPSRSGFGVFAEVLIRLISSGYSFIEMPVASRNRELGRSKALHWRNVASVLRNIVFVWWSVRMRPVARRAGARRLHVKKEV